MAMSHSEQFGSGQDLTLPYYHHPALPLPPEPRVDNSTSNLLSASLYIPLIQSTRPPLYNYLRASPSLHILQPTNKSCYTTTSHTNSKMSPTYTMSAHLCKSIYASWRETRRSPSDLPSPGVQAPSMTSYFPRSPSPEKRSMDSDRSETTVPMSRSPSASSWRGPK
ncbi:hypothetical protein CSPX01_04667 [Colletotrichum filicis]|nr:hypothetical protein CSPX01_04667 [Colletotrichum filicis]